MKNIVRTVLLLLAGICNLNSYAVYLTVVDTNQVNDGPYIFYVNDTLRAKMIENNVLNEYFILQENYPDLKTVFNLSCNYEDLIGVFSQKTDYNQNFTGVDSIIAISDVHGQYQLYINQLIANGVIDENLNWKFGRGHFVFLGDAFDRGDMVTEIFWHLFILEKQAAKAGGMVHVLVGNHESMVLQQDLRYMNKKYKKVEEISHTRYFDLYSENSVLGKWLRSKPVVISINDIIFVHAGISMELAQRKLSIKRINKVFASCIIGKSMNSTEKNKKAELLSGNYGPLWYRGYFEDSTFCEKKLDSILCYYKKKHIVVGHTTYKKIKTLFNNKIIGIDAGIGYGQPGEVLIYKRGDFYIGSNSGVRIKL